MSIHSQILPSNHPLFPITVTPPLNPLTPRFLSTEEKPRSSLERRIGSRGSDSTSLTYRICPDSPISLEYQDPEEEELPSNPPNLGSHVLEDEHHLRSPPPSVEFIDELPPFLPRSYFSSGPFQSLESILSVLPLSSTPLPPGAFSIGPNEIDLETVCAFLPYIPPDGIIPVFLPYTFPSYYSVPKIIFLNHFRPNSATVTEI